MVAVFVMRRLCARPTPSSSRPSTNLAVPSVRTGGEIKFCNSARQVHLIADLQALLTNQFATYSEIGTPPLAARSCLTGTGPTTATHLAAYGDRTLPKVANLCLTAGETRAVLALVPIDANGSVSALADLQGYIG
jgi:hypothetical protein